MQLRVLGPLEVVRDDTAVRVPSAQQRRVLTALAMAPGAVVSIDRLVFALWGDRPPPSAVKSLHAHVSRLRTALADPAGGDPPGDVIIITAPSGYTLAMADDAIDAARFEALVERSRTSRASDPRRALDLLDEGLALWRGSAYADFADEAFVRADAVRLEELRLAAAEDRFDLLLDAGRHHAVMAELERFVRRHPLRERPHAQLMLALYRSGRQADALEVYRSFRMVLADQLAIEPSAALRELEADVLRQHPRLDSDPPASHARGGDGAPASARSNDPGTGHSEIPPPGPPLVERDRQLAVLEELLGGVAGTGRGRLATVHGEAGVGKTALVHALCAGRDDVRVLWGACDPLFTPRPLGAFRDVAEAAGGALRAAVAADAPSYAVAADLFAALRAVSPTILVVEDLQWADEATLDVLNLLGRRVSAVPVLVVATYRDDEAHPTHQVRRVLGELATSPAVIDLPLGPLSVGAVVQLATPQGRDGGHIHRVTAGNPLFVIEVLAAPTTEVPSTIRQAVLGRVGSLDHAARTVLEAIAIAPPRLDVSLLEVIVGADADGLDRCVTAGLVVVDSSGATFRHELARRAIVAAIPVHRGITLHRRALDAMSALPEDRQDAARQAHHAEAAGDGAAVVRFADRAGRQAARMGAHREAAAHYASVLRHADRLDLPARASVFERRARSCHLTDENSRAIEAMDQAVRFYARLGDRRAEGNALRLLSQFLWCPGRTVAAMASARKAVDLLEQLPPSQELGMACSNVAQLALNAEDVDGVVVWSTRALEIAAAVDDAAIDVHATTNLATVAALAGDTAAAAQFDGCVDLADAAGLDEHATRALLNRGVSAVRRHRPGDAVDALAQAEARCRALGHELMLFYVRAYQATVALDVG